MLKIYGNPLSVFVNKVNFLVTYLGLDHEFIELDLMKGELKSAEFLAINPIGKMPAIVDGDFNLAESLAIMRYLADKNNSDLYPKALKERAVVDQWLDFTTVHIGTPLLKIAVNKVFYKIFNMEPDLRSLKENEELLLRFLPLLEKQLQKSHKYVCGEKLSLADFSLLASLGLTDVTDYSLNDYPTISSWLKDLRSMEFYKAYGKDISTVLESVMVS